MGDSTLRMIMKLFPTLRLHAFAALFAALFLPALSAHAQSFTANFASDQGAFLRRGQGYLYSWWHGRESPMHGNLELKPNSWRIGYWGTWDYEYQPMVDQGVNHIQVILTDVFRNRGGATVGGFSHDYTWQSKGYVQVVEDTVLLVNARGWTNVAFDLINEPDAFGIDGISDWYADAWVPAFRKIRQLILLQAHRASISLQTLLHPLPPVVLQHQLEAHLLLLQSQLQFADGQGSL